MRIGVRVVRGSNWKWQDQDGGEGHVGTVVELPVTSPKTAIVQWDSKSAMNYRAGYNDRYDLKVYDSGPAGIKHPYPCAACDEREIYGILFSCCQCSDIHLCTPCYMNDRHSVDHPFKRYTTPELPPVVLPPRRNSRKIDSYGIFREAMVKRGKDWIWGNQDGTDGGLGRVFQVQGWVEESRRSVVRIEWRTARGSNVYRVGHRGKADLHAVTPTKGWPYYVDHLPNYGEELIGQRPPMFALCENVRVDDNLARVQHLAENHGGWHANMQMYVGHIGSVHRITDKNDVRVLFNDAQKWTYNAKALTKIFRQNDKVMVTEDLETLKEFHGDEVQNFRPLCGKKGIIWAVPDDSSLFLVKFSATQSRYVHSNCLYLVDAGNPATNVLLEETPASTSTRPTATAMAGPARTTAPPSVAHPLAASVESMEIDDFEDFQPLETPKIEPTQAEIAHFFSSIDDGSPDVVRDYLRRFPQLINCSLNDEKPLFRAVNQNRADILNVFTFMCGDFAFDDFDANGDTAAHVAIRKNLLEIVKLFATKTYWSRLINKQNGEFLTPLHLSVKLGFLDCVRILMHNDQILCNSKNNDGDMPLHTSINFNKESVSEFLVSCPNVDPSLLNDAGQNSLHLASIKGQLKVAQKILDKKPELINVINKVGFAPLHLAVFHNQHRIVELFLRQPFINKNARVMKNREFISFTSLHLAVYQMYPEMVERLIESGVELNLFEDINRCTPLHIAVEILISRGCNLTPDCLLELQQVEQNQLKMNNLLRLCGDCTPLAVCCYLLGKGADHSLKNKSKFTPFEMIQEKMKRLAAILRSFTLLHNTNAHASTSRSSSAVLPKSNQVEGEKCHLCNDALSNVRFEPCNHILYCVNCIRVAASQIKKCIKCDSEVVAKIGPAGEIRPRVQSNDASGSNENFCTVCFEKPKSWMTPKCGHALCRQCCQTVKECPLCRQPMVDLRQVFL